MMGCKALCFLFSELGIGITVRVKRHFGSHHKELLQNGSRKKGAVIQQSHSTFSVKFYINLQKLKTKLCNLMYIGPCIILIVE